MGTFEFCGGRQTFVPSHPVEVVEPVGAGAAFAAGYLSGILNGARPEDRLQRGHDLAARALSSTSDSVAVDAE